MGFWTRVKTWLWKKESEMSAKAKSDLVRFLVTDGVKPNRVGPARVFNLKAPIALNIPPGVTVKVKLGVSCNYPLHVFQARGCLQRGLKLPDGIWAAQDADTDLELTIKNESQETALIERGDVLARAFIISNVDIFENLD